VNPFFISDDHANEYADKMPPWGFNGLGYVTYKRTYARPIFEGNTDVIERTEEWHETIQRVVNGAQNIGAQLTQDEAEQ
jgi:ribonucleoside-triphosphate reductase (thioredoxin)